MRSRSPPALAQDRRLLAKPAGEQPASFSHCHLPGKEKPSDLDVSEGDVFVGPFDNWDRARSSLTPS